LAAPRRVAGTWTILSSGSWPKNWRDEVKTLKIALIYPRVSTEDQKEYGYSLADQRDRCIAKAKELGATKIIETADEGVSGSILERPGLSEARELIRNGSIDYFICLDPDRLARKLAHQLIVSDEIERAGCQLVFVDSEYKNTPEGRLFYSMRGAFAEFEKEKITQRLLRGSRQKAKEGKLIHDPGTYGYDYIKGEGRLEINSKEAPVVRMVYEWFAYEQLGYNQIAERLSELGIPTKRGNPRWYASTLTGLLSNPTYTGTITLFKQNKTGTKFNKHRPPNERIKESVHPKDYWIEVEVPRLISDELFEAAQLQAARVSRTFRKRAQHRDYLMSGLMRCGLCGTAYCGTSRKYYICNRRYTQDPNIERCLDSVRLRADDIDARIWDKVVGWIERPSELRETLKSQMEPENPYKQSELRILEESLADCAKQQNRLLDLVQQGLVEVADVRERLEEIKQRESKAREALAKYGAKSKAPRLPALKDLSSALKVLRSSIKHADFDERQYIVRTLVEEVIVYPDHLQVKAQIPHPQQQTH